MNLRTRCLTLVAILVFANLAAFGLKQGSAAAQGRISHREAVGVNSNCANAVYKALQTAKVEWVRITLPWYDIQPYDPSSAPPGYEGGSLDPNFLRAFKTCVDQAIGNGLKVLVVFHTAPLWALSADGVPDPIAYALAARSLAKVLPEVSAWEIWNEQNMHKSWRGNPHQYVLLLRAAYTAIKQANPAALVVFGGTEHNGAGWLRRCYKAGARGYFDVFADHPYPPHKAIGSWGHALSSVSKARAVMVAYGDSAKPIWLTEFGWSRSAVSPNKQARLLTKSYSFIAAHQKYVKAAFWYQAEDSCSAPDEWACGLGLLTSTGEPTPAYWALSAYAARHGGR
jgi:polysaccharide biosynthesis protein PslG